MIFPAFAAQCVSIIAAIEGIGKCATNEDIIPITTEHRPGSDAIAPALVEIGTSAKCDIAAKSATVDHGHIATIVTDRGIAPADQPKIADERALSGRSRDKDTVSSPADVAAVGEIAVIAGYP